MEQIDSTSSSSSSNQLEVLSMVIWLSTGNGKFFELVRYACQSIDVNHRFLLICCCSMALVIQSNKSYRNHLRPLSVGVIIIHRLIPIDCRIHKFSKLFSKLAFVSKARQAQAHKVFYVLNTYLSNVKHHEQPDVNV
jgi:hypothetical protein